MKQLLVICLVLVGAPAHPAAVPALDLSRVMPLDGLDLPGSPPNFQAKVETDGKGLHGSRQPVTTSERDADEARKNTNGESFQFLETLRRIMAGDTAGVEIIQFQRRIREYSTMRELLNTLKLRGNNTDFLLNADRLSRVSDERSRGPVDRKTVERGEDVDQHDGDDYDVLGCGINNAQARILGGRLTASGDWPWQAALVHAPSRAAFCGASLVNKHFVLTAAHCASVLPVHKVLVWLGVHDVSLTTEEGRQSRTVSHIILHENFNAKNLANDVALLRLSEPVSMTHRIRPVCLPDVKEWDVSMADGGAAMAGIVAGWGLTTEEGYPSKVLLQVSLPFLRVEDCKRRYEGIISVSSKMLCTLHSFADGVSRDSCKVGSSMRFNLVRMSLVVNTLLLFWLWRTLLINTYKSQSSLAAAMQQINMSQEEIVCEWVEEERVEEEPNDSVIRKIYPKSIECVSGELKPSIYQRGQYWVLENYIPAAQVFPCNQSITYTTHADYTYLDNLEPLTSRWQVPSTEELLARKTDCLQEMANLTSMVTYRHHQGLLYPVNVARNTARHAANTYFVLPSDIELYPSINFIPEFLRMLRRSDVSRSKKPRVYVLPIFEVKAGVSPPQTKTELLQLLRSKRAIPFHAYVCKSCHSLPKEKTWRRTREKKELSVLHIAKRHGRHNKWEPIYVGTNTEPLYDERLSWEGQRDKMTQMYALCVMDYEFHILDSAFLVHRPGIKKKKTTDRTTDALITNQNKLINKQIFSEYTNIYGQRAKCVM